jgi:uncharacterized protein (TIGR03437 family)
MDKMRSYVIAAFLFLALAGILPAQFTITTSSLPTGITGVAYSAQLQTSGAEGQVSWYMNCHPDSNCIPGGSPAPGLTLDGGSGAITGTPTTVGVFSFTVEAEYNDSDTFTTSKQLSINVMNPCTPTISPASPLPGADINIEITPVIFSASGCPGPFTFTAQSTGFGQLPLPPGLTLNNTNLSGTPTQVGAYTFDILANGPNESSADVQYALTVNPLPTVTTASPLPSGPVGGLYSQQFAATGGVPGANGYTFLESGSLPPGMTFSSSGLLSGTPTQAGPFSFNIGVEDSLGGQTSSAFQVSFFSGTPQLQVSPQSLTFNAALQGNPPLSQAILVTPSTSAKPPVTFSLLIDNGQSNTSAPAWITVSPTSGAAPAGLVVNVNQGSLAAGTYPARIRVLDSNNVPTDVSVTLNVTNTPQQLTVSPSILSFGARAAAPGKLVENLVVSNVGAVPLAFNATVLGGSSWISGISPSSGQSDAPVFLQVQLNTSGLQVGAYHDVIQLASAAGNVQIPISLFVATSGPLLGVNTTGVLFQARQNGGSSVSSNIEVLNIGDPASTVHWTASLVTGSDWLNLVSSSGTATPAAPGVLSLALVQNATQMSPGPYYALIRIADPKSLNSPQFVSAVLDLEPDSAAATPVDSPAGLFFATTPGGAAPSPQQVLVNTSSSSPVPFQVATNQAWLSATPSSGNASGLAPGNLSVSVNPTGLAAGIYSGNVSASIGQALQSVNVTFVVLPASAANASRPRPEVLGCTPSKLAITETGLANNFAVPAGWPASLIVQLNDDCGSLVLDGNVAANFSNGDPALALVGDSLGNYSGTWAPGAVTSELVVTLNATAGALHPATATLYGGIAKNQTPPPTLAPGGTLNNLNPVVGGALSPGTITQVYGSGLSATSVSIGILPLPANFNKTFAQVGAYQAPFYFLSSGQVNIQLPYDLTTSQQIPILFSVNNALTLPVTLDLVPTAPGVLSRLDGPTPPSVQNGAHIIAQHLNGTLVSSASPGKPSEYLVMYLVGLGATDPAVASGAPAPAAPATLASVTVTPIVTVDSQPSNVLFAGLTPGFVGLYQIDFQVPAGAHSGEVVITVTQNGVAANPTLLPVGP